MGFGLVESDHPFPLYTSMSVKLSVLLTLVPTATQYV